MNHTSNYRHIEEAETKLTSGLKNDSRTRIENHFLSQFLAFNQSGVTLTVYFLSFTPIRASQMSYSTFILVQTANLVKPKLAFVNRKSDSTSILQRRYIDPVFFFESLVHIFFMFFPFHVDGHAPITILSFGALCMKWAPAAVL